MAKAKIPTHKVTFSLMAPEAGSVSLLGDFTDWDKAPIVLKKTKKGVWSKSISLPSGMYEYRYLVDGKWQNDPSCESQAPNSFGSHNCVRVVHDEVPNPPAAPAA